MVNMGYEEHMEGEWTGGEARWWGEEHTEAEWGGEEHTEGRWGGGEARWRGEELLLTAGQEEELQEELSEGSSPHLVKGITCGFVVIIKLVCCL